MTVSGDRRRRPSDASQRRRVEPQPAVAERAAGAGLLERAAAALQDRADPRHHLARAERLDHIIVAAELEAEHPVDLVVARGEEQDRQIVAGAQLAADVEAVHPRHVDVEHDEVGALRRDRAERAFAVRRLGGLHPRLAEREAQHLADVRVVVDDQDAVAHRVHLCHRSGRAVKGLGGGGTGRPSQQPVAAAGNCGGRAPGERPGGGEAAGAAQRPAVPVGLVRRQRVHRPHAQPDRPARAARPGSGGAPARSAAARRTGRARSGSRGRARRRAPPVSRAWRTFQAAAIRPRSTEQQAPSTTSGREQIGVDQPAAAPAAQQPVADQGQAERDQRPSRSGRRCAGGSANRPRYSRRCAAWWRRPAAGSARSTDVTSRRIGREAAVAEPGRSVTSTNRPASKAVAISG